MVNKKGFKIIGLIVLCVCVAALFGVAYSDFLDRHVKDDKQEVESTWMVNFSNLITEKEAPVINKAPTIKNGTSISDADVTFNAPEQFHSIKFDVENKGSFDAKISSIILGDKKIDITSRLKDDEIELVNEYVKYSLTYADGSAVKEGDILKKNEKKSFILSLSYSSEGVEGVTLPTADINVKLASSSIIFAQA